MSRKDKRGFKFGQLSGRPISSSWGNLSSLKDLLSAREQGEKLALGSKFGESEKEDGIAYRKHVTR